MYDDILFGINYYEMIFILKKKIKADVYFIQHFLMKKYIE